MISSSHNPKIQWVRSLQAEAQARREQRLCVVEGVRLVEEALAAGWAARLVLYTDEISPRGRQVVEAYARQDAPVEQVTSQVLDSAADTETPQGLLAVLSIREMPEVQTPDFILILDGIRDPGNLGTILRSAQAARVEAVMISPGSADPFSPKVLRAAMGAHFRLPIARMSWAELHRYLNPLMKNGLCIYLADAAEGRAYNQADFRRPLGLVVGGEAQGAGKEALDLAHEKVHIPMPGAAESLNAAVAASILLFEVVRQRSMKG